MNSYKPRKQFWVQLHTPHGFACNIDQCPNGADFALTDNAENPNNNAYNLLCQDCFNELRGTTQ